jgi:hypothetical protein
MPYSASPSENSNWERAPFSSLSDWRTFWPDHLGVPSFPREVGYLSTPVGPLLLELFPLLVGSVLLLQQDVVPDVRPFQQLPEIPRTEERSC